MTSITETDLPTLLSGDIIYMHHLLAEAGDQLVYTSNPPPIAVMLLMEPGLVAGCRGSPRRFKLKYIAKEQIQEHVSEIAIVYGISDIYRSGKKIWSRLEPYEIKFLWEEMKVK